MLFLFSGNGPVQRGAWKRAASSRPFPAGRTEPPPAQGAARPCIATRNRPRLQPRRFGRPTGPGAPQPAHPGPGLFPAAMPMLRRPRPGRTGAVLAARRQNPAPGKTLAGILACGLVLLFLCLALPNGFIFRSAGVPVVIGITLAAVIAWVVHQAFVAPLALAGVSAALLAETKGREPDGSLRKARAPAYSPTSTVWIAVRPKYCGWYMPWAMVGIQVKRPPYMALMK